MEVGGVAGAEAATGTLAVGTLLTPSRLVPDELLAISTTFDFRFIVFRSVAARAELTSDGVGDTITDATAEATGAATGDATGADAAGAATLARAFEVTVTAGVTV